MANQKHGMSKTCIYHIWVNMKKNCKKGLLGPNVKVCERWEKFENFFEDMGDRRPYALLRRLDYTKDFDKDNCIWVY